MFLSYHFNIFLKLDGKIFNVNSAPAQLFRGFVKLFLVETDEETILVELS